jgi:hypothetical protein
MLNQEDAARWSLLFALLGVGAWMHKQPPLGWAVWVEDAGLLLQDRSELMGWLVLHLQREICREEAKHG